MKEFIQSLFKSTEERVKNPFIGAFLTSWVIFNWRPILVLFFSSEKIEDKIEFINKTFNDLNNILWYPLISAGFYIIILPLLSLLIEWSMVKPIKWRSDIFINKQLQDIDYQDQIALKRIQLEINETELKEKKKHNALIQELENQKRNVEEELIKEKELHSQFVNNLKTELQVKDKIIQEEQLNSERRISQLQKGIANINQEMNAKIEELTKINKKLREDYEKSGEKFYSLLQLENGNHILEVIHHNQRRYFDSVTLKPITEKSVLRTISTNNFLRLNLAEL